MNRTIWTAMMTLMLTATFATAQDVARIEARSPAPVATEALWKAPAADANRETESTAKSAKVEAPAEGEFAGATMIRFFSKALDEARESGKSMPLPAGDAVRIAAY